MNTLHLKYAVEIEKTGSISRAADNLFMGQPTLSKTIRELENYLGYKIFERTSKGVKPSDRGEEFLTYAKKILAEVERIEQIPLAEDKKTQVLDVAVPRATYIAYTFSRFAAGLDPEKNTAITYKETNAMRTINKISIGEYHLGVIRYQTEHEGYFTDFLRKKNFKLELLYEYNSLALMDKRHPLAGKKNLKYSDFAACTELLHGDNIVPYFVPSRPEKQFPGFDKHIYIFERGTQFELLNSVRDSYMWVSPLPQEVLDRHSLVQRRCDFPNGCMRDVLICLDDYKPTETEKAFLKALKETIKTVSSMTFE